MSKTLRKISNKQSKFAVVTWNMANKKPKPEDIDAIYDAIADDDYDGILVMAQEESLDQSLASALSAKFGSDKDTEIKTYLRSNVTYTKGLGQMSLAVITRHDLSKSIYQASDFTHRGGKPKAFANKGGHFATIKMGAVKLQFAGVHLDASSDTMKLYETQRIFSELETRENPSFYDYSALAKLAVDATIFGGDLNYRNFRVDNKEKDPFSAGDVISPARHFQYHNLQASEISKNTFSDGEDDKAFDNKRVVGGLAEANYLRSGILDRILGRGKNIQLSEGKIVETNTSDHKPVVVTATISAVKNFDRIKNWVASVIEPFADEKILRNIETLSENTEGENYLVGVFNYYLHIKELRLEGEHYRMKGDAMIAEALNNDSVDKSGLVDELTKLGDEYFSEKANLQDHAKTEALQRNVKNNIADAILANPKLKESPVISAFIKMVNWFSRAFTGKDRVVTLQARLINTANCRLFATQKPTVTNLPKLQLTC